MIGKKIANSRRTSSKAERITRLASYIRAPETESSTEKCNYAGTRGFLTDTAYAQTMEMVALAEDAVRSPDPINHYVLSWREGEQPSLDQVEGAVDILLDEMQLNGHQVIYGLHADTDNYHVHVMVNRVDPDTEKVRKINRGFDIEAVHRAVVRIEQAQGWEIDDNKRYRLNRHGALERTPIDAAPRPRRPSQQQLDRERRAGEKSAARTAIEIAAPIIAGAESWETLHTALEEHGMRYARAERTRRGAVVNIGDVTIKASRVGREATLRSLEKRLGAYQPPSRFADRTFEPRDAAPLIAVARSWPELHTALASKGLRYVKVGSGARIVSSTMEAKASVVSREASLTRLEERLGSYEPAETPTPAPEAATPHTPARTDPRSAAPLIAAVSTWRELHATLAEHGMRYERHGSGAHIIAGDIVFKASTVARQATLNALQDRLGAFEPAAGALASRTRVALDPGTPNLDEYRAAREAHRMAKDTDRQAIESEYERELEALRDKHEREREEALGQYSWKDLGLVLNAMRSVLATEQAEEMARLRERRRRAREEHRRRYPPWPSFEQWLMDQGAAELAYGWRHRDRPVPGFEGKGESDAVARAIEGYEAQVDGDRVLYRRRGAPRSRVAFADVGWRINVYDWRNEESTLAALQLSAEKWGQFFVTGNDEYKAMCVRLAARHGFQINNPELQERIADERARLQAEQEAAGQAQAERAQTERPAAERDHQEILDVAQASGPDGERHESQPPAPPQPSGERIEETIDVTHYGEEAVRLVREFEQLKREHGELTLQINPRTRDGSSVGLAFVDALGNQCWSGRESVTTIAAIEALLENRRPDEIPEIKRTIEREMAKVFERARTRGR